MIQECENDEPSIKRSAYVEEYLSNEDSSSDDDNQIDADEIKKLTAVIRRSNRVARPVYDSFIDQQVILLHQGSNRGGNLVMCCILKAMLICFLPNSG